MTWVNTLDTETIVASGQAPKLAPAKLIAIFKAFCERLNDQHISSVITSDKGDIIFALTGTKVSAENSGKHRSVTLVEVASKPAISANELKLYTKETDSKAELFMENEDATETQLTSLGAWIGSSVSADTEANFLAGTTPGTYDGQIKCGSDHNAIWRWDNDNEVWVKITPLVKHYVAGADETVSTSLVAKKIDGSNSSIALSLIKGEALMIDVTISVHADGATDPEDNRYVDVYVKRATVGSVKYLLTDGSAGNSDVATKHARMTINSDGNIVTGTFRFYDATPESTAAYVEHTYEVYVKKSTAPSTMYIRGIQTNLKIFRTSAIA